MRTGAHAKLGIAAGVGLVCLGMGGWAGADVVTLSPAKDNTLYETSSGNISNGTGNHIFAGRTNQADSVSRRRAVLMFDLTSIPSEAVINSVTLTLHMSQTIAGNQGVAMHRLLADWGEGPSQAFGGEGGGATAQPGDATWLHTFYDTEFWSTPGGDFATEASASTTVGGIGHYNWSSSQLVADVQAWLADPSTNFGWIAIGNELTSQTAKRFDSRENLNTDVRPRLEIDFSLSSVVAWANAAGGNWSVGENWSTGSAPNGIGAEALLGAVGDGPIVVTVDQPVTVGALTFDSAFGYTVAGSEALTVEVSSGSGMIDVASGSHAISAPVVLASNVNVNVAQPGDTLSISNLTAAGMGLSKSGAGTVEIGAITAGGLAVNEGTVRVLAGSGSSTTGGLSIASEAALDLTDNRITVEGGDLSAVNALVVSGRAGGDWNGPGIHSSIAAAESGRAVGLRQDGSDVEVGFTWAGDATLDGAVTIADLGVLAANWQGTDRFWFHGDFNYDGDVTIADLGILAANWQAGAGGSASMGFDEALAMFEVFDGVVVPEPGMGMFLIVGAGGVAGRRRRPGRPRSLPSSTAPAAARATMPAEVIKKNIPEQLQ